LLRTVHNEVDVSFPDKLKQLRKDAGLSQAKLGKRLGVTRNAVSQWEAGATEPSTKHLRKLAAALGAPLDQLVESTPAYEDEIITAATRLFDRLGYDKTSIEVICAAADVSQHEFDALFASKDELLYRVLTAYNERTFDDLRRIPAKYGTVVDRLKYLLHLYYVHDLAHLKLTAALHAYSWRWSEMRERDNQRQLSDHHDAVIAILEDAVGAGELHHGNFRAASELIFAAYTYALRKAVFSGHDADKLIAHLEPQLMVVLQGLGYRDRNGD
jgi:transcriptional regulator with XRE-family HTH domain